MRRIRTFVILAVLVGFFTFVSCNNVDKTANIGLSNNLLTIPAREFVTTGSSGAPASILGAQEASQYVSRKLASGHMLKFRNVNGYAIINDDEIVGYSKDLQKKADDFDEDFKNSNGNPKMVGKGVVIQQYCSWWIAYPWWCGTTQNWNNNRWPNSNSIPVFLLVLGLLVKFSL